MNNKTILLVEDNADDEVLTLRALRKNNISNRVVVARDGVEALDYLFGRAAYVGRDITDMPRLVLLDFNLPKMNGLEVLRRLRADERTARLPVVALTSSKEHRDIINCYDAHVNSYIRKPVDFVEFTESVRQLGLYWLDMNEPPPERPLFG